MLESSGYKVLSVPIQEYSLCVKSEPFVLSISFNSTSSKKPLQSSCKKQIYKNLCLKLDIFPITTLGLSYFIFISFLLLQLKMQIRLLSLQSKCFQPIQQQQYRIKCLQTLHLDFPHHPQPIFLSSGCTTYISPLFFCHNLMKPLEEMKKLSELLRHRKKTEVILNQLSNAFEFRVTCHCKSYAIFRVLLTMVIFTQNNFINLVINYAFWTIPS